MMKRSIWIVLFLVSSLAGQYRDQGIDVEVIFLPQAQRVVYQKLESILNSAKNRVLLSMYWLTYKPVVDKLIELKRKNIDVQVILDQSSLDIAEGAEAENALRAAGIPISISPSKQVQGKMHNKYLIIDNSKVWTGSANFTKSVLDPGDEYLNDENIVIMYSSKMVKSYTEQFDKLKQDIAGMERGEFLQPPQFSTFQRSLKRGPSGELPRERSRSRTQRFQSTRLEDSSSDEGESDRPTNEQREEILRLGGYIHPNLTRQKADAAIETLRRRR